MNCVETSFRLGLNGASNRLAKYILRMCCCRFKSTF